MLSKARLVHLLDVIVKPWTVGINQLIWNLTNHINYIHAETTDSLINPEIHHVIDFLAQLWIFPVEVWLLLTKEMQIILA